MSDAFPTCFDPARRGLLDGSPALNGIDFLEVSKDQKTLRVHLLNPMPSDAYGLPSIRSQIRIEGGVRVVNIKVVEVRRAAKSLLEIDVNTPGDFSTYTLHIENASFDPVYGHVDFSFKAGCPNRFDCKPRCSCPPSDREEPVIDYMAR